MIVASAALLLAGCSHDWEVYLPRAEPSGATGTGGGGGGTTGVGGRGGEGGNGAGGTGVGGGGGIPQGRCPELAGPPLVFVPAEAGLSYCVDATEVSSQHYLDWLGTMPSVGEQSDQCSGNLAFEPSSGWPPAEVDLPVSYVDWCDALAYCVGVGKRLCGRIGGGASPWEDFADAGSSAWHNACSASGARVFPYGDAYVPELCNGDGTGPSGPVTVGKHKGCVGGYPGLFDMSGNVWEWEDSCDEAIGMSDPCRIRGGSFNNGSTNLECGADSAASRESSAISIGIRCCADSLSSP